METSACVNRMRLSVVMVTIVIGTVAVTCAADFAKSSFSSFRQSQAGLPNIGLGTYGPPVAGFLEGAVGRRLAGANWRHFIANAWRRPELFRRPRGTLRRDTDRGDDEEEKGEEAAGRKESGQQFSGEQVLGQAALSDHPEEVKTGSGTASVLGGPTGRQSKRVSGSDQRQWNGKEAVQHAGFTRQFSRQELQETQRTSLEKRQSHYDQSRLEALESFFVAVRAVEKTLGRKT